MELNWRKRGEQNSKLCSYCDKEETLKHFLLECDAYNEIRAQHLFLARPYKEDPDELIAYFLPLSQISVQLKFVCHCLACFVENILNILICGLSP